MSLRDFLIFSAALAVPLCARADSRLRVSMAAFHDRQASAALERLEHSTDDFKAAVDKALDNSVLNGTPLEDRLNQWANLLEDEIDTAQKEFSRAAGSGSKPDAKAVERFGDHWGNAMMAAAAINRAMIRRGFAPVPERQWAGIRADLDTVALALGRPPLPDMTVVIFRPAPAGVLTRSDVKAAMQDLRSGSDRFEDRIEHAWFVGMGPTERHVLKRWADDLKAATEQLLDEYKDNDVREYQLRLEECLMLAAGMNRALLVSQASAAPVLEWQQVRTRLNTLAARFGYPAVPDSMRG